MELEVGAIFDGKVVGLTKFGAFVEFDGGKTGMVHISEVSSTFVKEITDFLSEGQDVKVKVVSISDTGKIALSMKKVEERKSEARPPKSPRQDRPQRRYQRPQPEARPARPGDYEWQAKKQNGSFEDMMSQFKQTSDEKISDLKKITDTKRGGGYSRRER